MCQIGNPCDNDCDGLPDDWERPDGGIDGDGDGDIDLRLYDLGARPDHRDLFVEVDSVTSTLLPSDVVDMIREAFCLAPVDSPGDVVDTFCRQKLAAKGLSRKKGIVLHVRQDEPGIVFASLPNDPTNLTGSEAEVSNIAEQLHVDSYGTVADRNLAERRGRLLAWRKVFRHCILLDTVTVDDKPAKKCGWRPESIGLVDGVRRGLASNHFFLLLSQCDAEWRRAAQALEPNPANPDPASVTRQVREFQATAFMHELGHTLGLGHGGWPGGQNFAPNYPSIMNYALAYRMPFSRSFWRLDYSRERIRQVLDATAIFDLTESVLLECEGIPSQGYTAYQLPYGTSYREGVRPTLNNCTVTTRDFECPAGSKDGQQRLMCFARLDGTPVDWDVYNDNDRDDCPRVVSQDINHFFVEGWTDACEPTPSSFLASQNDWATLIYAIPAGAAAEGTASGMTVDPYPDEPGPEFIAWASEYLVPACPDIARQPCDLSIEEGSLGGFSIEDSGSRPIVFQWRKDSIDLVDGGNISGAGTKHLVIDPVGEDDAGLYDVALTNECGVATSAPAELTVNPSAFRLSDCNGNGIVGLRDFATIHAGLFGPGRVGAAACFCGDLDRDGDVDLLDLAELQTEFTGSE